jgi:haloacetate dehalogenase
MTWFEGFEQRRFDVNGVTINARIGGPAEAAPLLMLHGFPQTHAIWHRVARELHGRFRFVLPDLRGYGDSAKPAGASDHANYSKRAMAQDMAALMTQLGHERFGVVGHDRGGRVAHRLALDHAARVSRLCVIDIAPTLDMYAATDMAFASAYYHWFHLIQPAPLPERMIGGDPKFCLHWALGGFGPQAADAAAPLGHAGPLRGPWGVSALGRPGSGRGSNGTAYIEPEALADYERCFCTPEAIHAACEDYRASAGIDLEHDRASRAAGAKVGCDMRVLWGERGVVHKLFDPLALWQAQCASRVSGDVMAAGHFIPEELPAQTATQLLRFFA